MRKINLILLFLLGCFVAIAQPGNDECTNVIELGVAPVCPDDIYNNVDATASPIWQDAEPACFNGGGAQNDVWFTFSTEDAPLSFTITLTGNDTGANGSLQNPQMAIYRGDCAPGDLAFYGCVSSNNGDTETSINLEGLTPFTTYFIRVNDYSASASPNWGDFNLCIEEYIAAFNIGGDVSFSSSCNGTLHDSGGPDGDYSDNEVAEFTVCPDTSPQCIELNVTQYNIENNADGLEIYAGNSTSSPLVTTLSGAALGGLPIFIDASCVTFQFTSDFSVTQSGFTVEWSCDSDPCEYPDISDATVIPSLPYSEDGFSNCDSPLSLFDSPCNEAFLQGPKFFFQYTVTEANSDCHKVEISGAPTGTGIAILNGLPTDPDTDCVKTSATGNVSGPLFQEPGTYYIIVANEGTCVDFDIDITLIDCPLSLTLEEALCNPLNGCIDDTEVPSIFFFEQGVQDIEIVNGVNAGCWGGVGSQADFFWFTIEAQADGPFGFVLESAGAPSDIDFNVWGPFSEEAVCEQKDSVIQYIETNEPIRSSYAGGTEPTGLAAINPLTGVVAIDEWDCQGDNDDIVLPIDALEGEVFVVLVNDWGNQIVDEGISVDWAPSFSDVLYTNPLSASLTDTAVCVGQPLELALDEDIQFIEWIDATGTLSCTDCPNPIATVTETTIYDLVYETACGPDTADVKVSIIEGNAVGDATICQGEFTQVSAGSEYPFVDYTWTADASIEFSCTDCPSPMVTGSEAGTFTLTVTGATNFCSFDDEVVITILEESIPEYTILDDGEICESAGAHLGGPQMGITNYSWTSSPEGFTSDEANPFVMPTETTTYYLVASGDLCPIVEYDTVTVTVIPDAMPDLSISAVPEKDVYCQGDTIIFTSPTYSPGQYYYLSHEWLAPAPGLNSSDELWNAVILAEETFTYQRVTYNSICRDTSEITIVVEQPLPFEILPPNAEICEGGSIELMATVPDTVALSWSPGGADMSCNDCPTPTVSPTQTTTYVATVEGECPSYASAIVNVVESPISMTLDVTPATVYVGETITMTATTTPASTGNYMWYLNGELIGESTEPMFSYVVSSSYEDLTQVPCSVSFLDDESCGATASSSIEILPSELDIPNTFSPNGDGINDRFIVHKNDGVVISSMRIYSRWGELVFEGDNENSEWDGTYNGKPSPNDVYLYYIEFKNKEALEGEINLVR